MHTRGTPSLHAHRLRRMTQAKLVGDQLHFQGLIAKPDGSLKFETSRIGAPEDGVKLGREAGEVHQFPTPDWECSSRLLHHRVDMVPYSRHCRS